MIPNERDKQGYDLIYARAQELAKAGKPYCILLDTQYGNWHDAVGRDGFTFYSDLMQYCRTEGLRPPCVVPTTGNPGLIRVWSSKYPELHPIEKATSDYDRVIEIINEESKKHYEAK